MTKLFTAAAAVPAPAPVSPAGGDLRVSFHDLVLDALVGVYAHERTARQPIRLSVALDLIYPGPSGEDAARWSRQLVESGHVTLIETLAERIAARCLQDSRVREVTVRVEKLEVFPDTVVGIEIVRSR